MSAVAPLPENWPVLPIAHANAGLAASDSPLHLGDGEVYGVPMKVYDQAPPTIRFIVEMAEAQFGEADYIVYEDERVTYASFTRAVEHFAGILIEKYGVQKGDRVVQPAMRLRCPRALAPSAGVVSLPVSHLSTCTTTPPPQPPPPPQQQQ